MTRNESAGQEETGECRCFGNLGIHASTHAPSWTHRRCCDFCGLPVPESSVDALTAINSQEA